MKLPKKRKVGISIFVKILIPLTFAMVLIHVIVATTILPFLRPFPPGGPPPGFHPRSVEKNFSPQPAGDLDKLPLPGPAAPPFRGGPPNPVMNPFFWVLLGLQVAVVLLLCYAILAWQLRPIRKLSEAMTKLSKGDLKHRTQIRDSSEFGLLGEGFNEMAQKIETMITAKEELILGVSHELRSPLASANVLIEMINDEKKKNQIRVQLNRMDLLVEELLESHRISSEHAKPKLVPVNISEVFASLRDRYQNTPPGLVIHPISPDFVAPIDLRYFDRLLSNLIENALKYSGDSKRSVEITHAISDKYLRIDIIDYGPGVPAADLPNIFEPFYRVDKSRNRETGGFGLGLYLCAKIVSMHQGEIYATNRPEGGCTFSLRLPRLVETVPSAA